jgi:beta-phosphoglucomutase
MNSQYSAALFDLDGVITSTTHQHFQAWQIKIKEHFNIDVDPSLETLTRGVSRIESLRILLNAYDVSADEVNTSKSCLRKERIIPRTY